jgi:hypothetical protein
MKLDLSVVQILQGVESEFRNQYWHIRNARGTHWKAVNRTRVLAEVMRVCGVPEEAIKEARYCLRVRVCQRCADQPYRCYQLSERALAGEFST